MPQSKAKLIDAPLEALSNVQGTPADGQTLVYDSSTGQWEPGSIASGSGGVTVAANQSDSGVSLLLHMEGANGSTTFTDSGYYGNTITAYGNAQLSTAQAKYGSTSAVFDGSGDYLSFPATGQFSFGTGDFTVEAWVYPTSVGGGYNPIVEGRASASFSNYIFGLYNISGKNRLDIVTATGRLTGTTTEVSLNTWTHVAWTRSNGVISCFVNGVRDASTLTYSGVFSPVRSAILVGAAVDPLYFNGYIDELRITKGLARYTSNFTPSTAAFPDAAAVLAQDPYFFSTSLLLHMEGSNGSTIFSDSGCYINSVTAYGNAKISTTQSKFGSTSAYFDGTGDYLTLTSASGGLNLFNTSFTIEGWIYPQGSGDRHIFGYNSTSASDFWDIRLNGSGNIVFRYAANNGSLTSTSTISNNQWSHFAVVCDASSTTIYINGTAAGTAAVKITTANGNHVLGIGVNLYGSGFDFYFNGYMDELRITKGVARYTSNFTPPTAAFPDDSVPLPAPAVTGQLFSDGNYLYVCLAGGNPGTWRRVGLSSF